MNMRLGKNELMGLAGLISFGMLCAWPYQQFACYNKYNYDACAEKTENITAITTSIGLVFINLTFCYCFFQKCSALNQRAYSVEDSDDPNLAYLNFMFRGRVDENQLELEQL